MPQQTLNVFEVELVPIRPSKLLGKKIRFERASALNFSPDTILRVVTEKPLSSHISALNYSAYLAMVALDRSDRTGSKLQAKTHGDIVKILGEAQTPDGLPVTVERLKEMTGNRAAPWRVVRFAFTRALDRTGRRLLARLAYYDRLTTEFTRIRHLPEQVERIKQIVTPSIRYWNDLKLGMRWEVIAVLDAALQHLTWLDLEHRTNEPSRQGSAVLRLTAPTRRPMRHWFDQLLQTMGCSDLKGLHQELVRRRAIRHGNVVSHDLLKKWASSQRTLPFAAAKVLLLACFSEKAGKSVDAIDLWFAKLLMFLIEVICCFAKEPIEPLAAQAHIHLRLKHLEKEFQAAKGKPGTRLFLF